MTDKIGLSYSQLPPIFLLYKHSNARFIQTTHEIFNNDIHVFGQAHSQLCVVEGFWRGVSELRATASAPLAAILTALCQFYTLQGVVKDAGSFLHVSKTKRFLLFEILSFSSCMYVV
jgi:hypothetical protein